MRYASLLLILLIACGGPSSEKTVEEDSTGSQPFEDFSAVTPFTIKEELRSKPLLLMGKHGTMLEFLTTFYAPDTFTEKNSDDTEEAPAYIITDVTVIEGDFFFQETACRTKTALLTTRGDFIDQEYFDLLCLQRDAKGNVIVVDKLTFDGSSGQSSTFISVEKEPLTIKNDCVVLKVTTASEGGDINLSKTETIEYFTATETGFHSVLRVETEKTSIRDYQVDMDENQSAFSETREILIQKTGSNGLFDVVVHYKNMEHGDLILDNRDTYRFNGEQYVRE